MSNLLIYQAMFIPFRINNLALVARNLLILLKIHSRCNYVLSLSTMLLYTKWKQILKEKTIWKMS